MISILLTIKDRQDYLDRQVEFLSSFLSSSNQQIEVIFFDDGSKSPLSINASVPNFRIERSDRNLGLVEARNRLAGLSSEDSDYLLFLDDDIFVYNLEGFLNDAINAIESGYSCAVLPYINLPTFKHEKISTFRHVFDISKSDDDVVYFIGGTSMFSKPDFIKAGGLEGLYYMYLEEEDLAIRMFTLGMKIKVMYSGRYIGLHDQAPGKDKKERQMYLLSNRLLFHYKFVKNTLLRTTLNSAYVLLYLIKTRSLSLIRDSLARYKTKKGEIGQFEIPFTTLIRFFMKRYFNV